MQLYQEQIDQDHKIDIILFNHNLDLSEEESLVCAQRFSQLNETDTIVLAPVDVTHEDNPYIQSGIHSVIRKPARSAVLFETIAEILGDNSVESYGGEESVIQPIQNNFPTIDEKRRILLAEDNHINQLVVRHMLDPNRYDLEIAENGKVAFEKFKSTPEAFDIILMDVSMPVMDGRDATRNIRKFEHQQELDPTPIICLTAHVMPADVLKSKQAGMDGYLAKPIAQAELESAIAKWFAHSKNQDDLADNMQTANAVSR